MKKIRIAAVSYLNTKPLLYGIKHSAEIQDKIKLVEDYPAKIAEMLLKGSVDAGLVPVAVIPKMREWHIISDFCIGADGCVASVCLFSDVPVEKIEKILFDYQSRSSTALCKILLSDYWHINPDVEETSEDFSDDIRDSTAGVIIGDRALEQRHKSKYMYDLGFAWKQMTGLPFVFAAWVANKILPEEFISLFNKLNGVGVNSIESVLQENNSQLYDLKKYYTENISYNLTDEKMKGMKLFLRLIKEKQLI